MEIIDAKYSASYPSISKCPVEKKPKPEYAFIGRSNVGKSSLINMLCKKKGLAKISKKPGKTQMINYFSINETWYLVDLPGYGYAKISKKKRLEWERMIANYLQKRETLVCIFVLIDSNIPPQQIDIEFINKLGQWRLPFVIVYTKTDRMNRETRKRNIKIIQEELLKYWNELPQQFVTSANSGVGRQEILEMIDEVNQNFL